MATPEKTVSMRHVPRTAMARASATWADASATPATKGRTAPRGPVSTNVLARACATLSLTLVGVTLATTGPTVHSRTVPATVLAWECAFGRITRWLSASAMLATLARHARLKSVSTTAAIRGGASTGSASVMPGTRV